jgi:hypothetical protein
MKTNWALIAMTTSFTLMLSINTHSYAFHENLGIDDNKASELYQTNPNDPAILQWKSALQSAITSMDKCFGFDAQEIIDCQSLIPIIVSNCKSHPNTLLACNDARLPQYPLILKMAQEAQIKAQKAAEEQRKNVFSTTISKYGVSVIEKCFSNPNSNTTFEVTSPSCDDKLLSLQRDCQMASSPYEYCKDQRFIGYLAQHNIILNSTVAP